MRSRPVSDAVHGAVVSATLDSALVKAIKAERARAGLTQTELAERMGWKSRETVAQIELGERKILANELVDFCAAFGVGLATLLVEVNDRDRRTMRL
jgi:transcriptional regulator with XRE-family HTH domain